MPKLHVLIFAYKRVIPLRLTIDCFLCQTNPDWQITIIHDGPAPLDLLNVVYSYHDKRINYVATPENNGGYGFPNRKWFLETQAKAEDGNWLLFCSDDAYYVPTFVQQVFAEMKEDTGIVYYDSVHAHHNHAVLKGEMKISHVDMGQFIVKLTLGKTSGFTFNNENVYYADGIFAEQCYSTAKRLGLKAVYIPRPIFVKN